MEAWAVSRDPLALSLEMSELPKQQEWEPNLVLVSTLEELSLQPGTSHDDDLARLKPHLEQALESLDCLERQRGISDRERMRADVLRMLLASIDQI